MLKNNRKIEEKWIIIEEKVREWYRESNRQLKIQNIGNRGRKRKHGTKNGKEISRIDREEMKKEEKG